MPPTQINALKIIRVGESPEDVLIDKDDTIITGLQDGRLVRVTHNGAVNDIVNTGGRPLGLDFLPDGRILVCDTRLGLLAVAAETGHIETLVPNGTARLNTCNNPAVAKDGRIFFSDSSQRHSEKQAVKDIIDAIPTGRLLCRYPNGHVEMLLDKLLFANGVVLVPDDSFVLVAQTGLGCINRLWLTGDKAGQQDEFTSEMPGLPDNLSMGTDGLLWVALVSPFSHILRQLHGMPLMARYLIARLPAFLQPRQELFCRLAAYDLAGNLVHLFEGNKDQFDFVTGVREQNGTIYMGSYTGDSIAHFNLEMHQQP